VEASASDLGVVQETLLIPLAARAAAARHWPELGFADAIAEDLVARLDADTDRFLVDTPSMVGSILRAQWFDRLASDFIQRHPDGLCVDLGAGLDTRGQRIDACAGPGIDWIDIDLADVTRLRKALLPHHPRIRTLTADITKGAWLDRLPWTACRPVLMMAEGVLMYLEPAAAKGLIAGICAAADARGAALEFAFDYASPMMVRQGRQHPSVAKTRAEFRWGLYHPRDLKRIDPRLRLVDHADIMPFAGILTAMMCMTYTVMSGGRLYYGLARFRREPRPAGGADGAASRRKR